MDQANQEKLKNKLIASKKDVERQLGKFADKDEKISGNFQTRYPDYGSEMQDSAEEVSDYDRALPVEHQLEDELVKIKDALSKIENGSEYGKCEKCGREIELKRLEANPQARRCLACAQADN